LHSRASRRLSVLNHQGFNPLLKNRTHTLRLVPTATVLNAMLPVTGRLRSDFVYKKNTARKSAELPNFTGFQQIFRLVFRTSLLIHSGLTLPQ
jgi:hypothetical protein